jgi:hypothetical protein
MSVTEKIDKFLGEAVVPSQQGIRSEMAKGLKDIPEYTSSIAMALWHYFNLNIVGGNTYPGKGTSGVINQGKIFKSQSSNKLSDELWYRIGRGVEDSEHLTDSAMKKLKSNFYSIIGKWGKVYTYNEKLKAWEFTG